MNVQQYKTVLSELAIAMRTTEPYVQQIVVSHASHFDVSQQVRKDSDGAAFQVEVHGLFLRREEILSVP